MKRLHLPSSEQTNTHLRAEAERPPMPAITVARDARRDRIATCAAEMAGTDLDLDTDLESAGIEHLVKTGSATK
jgi:hypothetical protein